MRSGRFSSEMGDEMQRLNASVGFDRRLFIEDIQGSLAWVGALARAGFLTDDERMKLAKGLDRIHQEIEEGRFEFSERLEDIHMNIEARLTELVGEPGEKLHTGRSRNDQVATDLRLWTRRRGRELAEGVRALVAGLIDLADRHMEVVIPAYTHLQRAQPVLFSHHLLAYAEMFLRDEERMNWAADRADVCPLGSGACVGNQFGIDREYLRDQLGFSRLTRNSLDAVSDRDFACDLLYACAMFLVHLSRFSEDLILWSSSEFGFVVMADDVTSGSSMLPQKKNPDACELGRGKCGRLLGHLLGLMTTLKGLPLSYNKDLQEDKEGLFDSVDTVALLLPVFERLVRTLSVDADRARKALDGGYLEAISVADYLTRKGIPFRKAHGIAGSAVRRAEEMEVGLKDLSIEEYRSLCQEIDEDIFEAISIQGALEDKDVIGGTAPRRVREEIERLKTHIHPG